MDYNVFVPSPSEEMPDTTIPGSGPSSTPVKPPALAPELSTAFAEFARACKAAARAVALYPGTHPAIGVSLGRLVHATTRLAEKGPFQIQVRGISLLLGGAVCARPDPAIGELAEVLSRHTIGALTVNAEATTPVTN